MTLRKYKVVDVYEYKDTLGYVDSMLAVRELARQRYNDTDAECLIEVRELNKETGKYKFLKILKVF